MRPRVKPALRRILRDEHTLQIGAHPARAVILTGLTAPVRRWLALLDGTRDMRQVLRAASAAGLDEPMARALLDQLIARRVLHDASADHVSLRGLSLTERDRLEPDVDALDLASAGSDGGSAAFAARRRARVRVYGAGRVGAQIVTLLASCGVGDIRVFDPGPVRPRDLTPGGLTWSELGLSRQGGAVATARRLTSGGASPSRQANGTPSRQVNGAPSQEANGTPGQTARGTPPSNNPPTAGRPTPTPPIPSRRGPHPRAKHISSTTVPPLARPKQTSTPSLRPGDHPPTAAGFTQPPNPHPPSAPAQDNAPSARGQGDPPKVGQPDDRPPTAPDDVHAHPASPRRSLQPARDHARPHPTITPPAPPGTPSTLVQAGGPYLGDGTHRPDLVILAPVDPLDFVLVNELAELGIPHLLASAFEGHGSVGPLVLPGRTACLHCLDLTRRDRDPGWAMVTARLGGYPPGELACDTTLATAVAAAATGHALAYLDGRPSAVTNCTTDVTPDGRWCSAPWTRHPECRCMRNNPYSLRMVVSPEGD
ncbi:ThiF family adenylyltransferase [Nonomuraea rhodomycinica]|uniref:THIF-type NAD/FAD binding fold domain-containing protein n=1 Tax=Nonomuraea rhodomycinica TaxID=1712872 RepID=A0A7Y6IXZ5_9ACTN|nr:ThiF family adenylyltransferase [Nonomuraea rhodomycinica]NUW46499.1 hypothetical protein [Nonomuraea rhodomycinica]